MLLEQMNWMEVEEYLESDHRLVFVLGSTEEHGYLSLATDTLIPWTIAVEACEKENVVLAPALHFGVSHWSLAYPGTLSVSSHIYQQVVRDLLVSALKTGFRKILLLNGHSGNRGAREAAVEAILDYPEAQVWFRSWWELPGTVDILNAHGGIDHANWAENFPFTRVSVVPEGNKPARHDRSRRSPEAIRAAYPDGVFGGPYQQEDALMEDVLKSSVEAVRSILMAILEDRPQTTE